MFPRHRVTLSLSEHLSGQYTTMEPDTPAAGQRRADAMPQAPAMQAGRSRGTYASDTEEDAVHKLWLP